MSRLRLLVALCVLIPWSNHAQEPRAVPRIGLLDTGSLAARAVVGRAPFPPVSRGAAKVAPPVARLDRSSGLSYDRAP
jgi:hypothetical protein